MWEIIHIFHVFKNIMHGIGFVPLGFFMYYSPESISSKKLLSFQVRIELNTILFLIYDSAVGEYLIPLPMRNDLLKLSVSFHLIQSSSKSIAVFPLASSIINTSCVGELVEWIYLTQIQLYKEPLVLVF